MYIQRFTSHCIHLTINVEIEGYLLVCFIQNLYISCCLFCFLSVSVGAVVHLRIAGVYRQPSTFTSLTLIAATSFSSIMFFHGFAQFKQHSHYTSDSTAYRILVQHGFVCVCALVLCYSIHYSTPARWKTD